MLEKTAATTALVGALALGGMGFAGSAQAHPNPWIPQPPAPGEVATRIGVPPGHIGQVVGVPPGHWDKPWKWLS
ncbi:hypothetical protein BVC93_21725 [Mycobacterium sp. MS1601]|uniref:hypothetical protein n=1 Tax=Mycobacterium sp. MS1601 TaxID=1936029 RepID=UPI0009790AF7|nr:hypothetical protein [Mycobacterium sp. MS1601]AQA06594.1 hypothetical protein BVC93_21725 [Mycobacterium sp. MS1601]